MSLQGLHDGELSIVLEAGRLVPQNLLQQTQGQGSDGVLAGGEISSCIHSECDSQPVTLSGNQ